MPGMDRIELLSRVRAKYRELPIVISTTGDLGRIRDLGERAVTSPPTFGS
jgi:CheY-like chemotaxis protein